MVANFAKARKVAESVIAENYVFTAPVNPYELSANYGLTVTELDFPEQFSRYSGFINIETATVMVSLIDSPSRRRFTVAHELGHWLLHKDILKTSPERGVLPRLPLGKADTDPIEQEANTFAANLLVPLDLLKEYRSKDVSLMAKVFAVSDEVMGYRLRIKE